MFKKEKEGKMREPEKNAKMSVLSHLRDMAQESMGSKLKGLKKVSVASDSPEGLEKGLDKAKEIISSDDAEQEMADENSGHEQMSHVPHPEEVPNEHDEDMSLDEIEEKLQELQVLKNRLQHRSK